LIENNINYWFLGDLEIDGQTALLNTFKTKSFTFWTNKNIVLMAHHGSGNQNEELAKFLKPVLTIVSVGKDNPYGHPAKKALQIYEAAYSGVKSKIARTDLCGDISVNAVDNQINSSCVN
jgi:competence protein ComEC